jgi:hypothetical protein
MVYIIVLVLLLGIVWVVGGPLLRPGSSASGSGAEPRDAGELRRSERRIDLEAARDAKYREIRDAELDHQTGKLSDEDFTAIDGTLRAEAMQLLHELDSIEAAETAEAAEVRNAAAEARDVSEAVEVGDEATEQLPSQPQ